MNDLIERLKKRAEIRRQIPTRKSVLENKPDRIADLLEEAANAIETFKQTMKYPKNRQTIYCVVRTEQDSDPDGGLVFYTNPLECGSFRTYEAADNYKDVRIQNDIENKVRGYQYTVEASIYYDE